MELLIIFIPLLPALAALCIGLGQISGLLYGVRTQAITFHLACSSIYLTTFLSLLFLWKGVNGQQAGEIHVATWLASGTFTVDVSFYTGGFNILLSSLFSLLFVVIFRFSRNYLHSEPGFHRFFLLLSLFASAMYLLLLSANVLGTFFGWELAGLCSFLLIAFAWHRENASRNAYKVFIVNRVGDAFFILGAILCFSWLGTINWTEINASINLLSPGQASLIAFCFVLAAMVKSAQFPFTWWLNRSMEGPTPSSAVFYGAVMVHAGVFLLILLAPVLEQLPLISALLVLVGLVTFAYSILSTQTQVDVKSSLGLATTAQLGLMFVSCGFGFWQFALVHLCAHSIVRSYLYLTAPSILHNVHGNPVQPATLQHPLLRRLSLASLHNFWLEESMQQVVSQPCLNLAKDFSNIDDNLVDPVMGFPTAIVHSSANFAFREEQKIGARLDTGENIFSSGSGLAGKLTAWTAALSGWFEHHFVLKGVEKNLPEAGRRLGYIANHLEQILLQPRYLVAFILITLMFTF